MSLQTRLESLVAAIGADVKQIGTLARIYETSAIIQSGALLVNSDPLKPGVPVMRSCKITEARAIVKTAPTGQSILVYVYKNNSNYINTITIAAGATTGTIALSGANASAVAGDRWTYYVAQVGTTYPGADLVVGLLGEYT